MRAVRARGTLRNSTPVSGIGWRVGHGGLPLLTAHVEDEKRSGTDRCRLLVDQLTGRSYDSS